MPAGFTYHHYLNDWECQTSTGVGALGMDGIGSSARHAWRPISPSLNFCNFSFKRKVNEYRMYDPVMSSFLSVDAYVQSPDNSQNFNRYAYCLNNPLRYVDPTGWFYQGGHSGSSLQGPYECQWNSPLEPRDLGMRQLPDCPNPDILWMEANEQKGGGGGGSGPDNGLGGIGGWVKNDQRIEYNSKATTDTPNWLGATYCQDNTYYGLFGMMYDLTTEEGRFGKAVDEAIIEFVEDTRNQDPFDVYVAQPSTSDFSEVAEYKPKSKFTGFDSDNIHRGYNYNGGQGSLAICDNENALQLYFEGWTTATNTLDGNPTSIRSFSQSSIVTFKDGYPIYFKYHDRAAAVVIFHSREDVNRIYGSFRRTFGL